MTAGRAVVAHRRTVQRCLCPIDGPKKISVNKALDLVCTPGCKVGQRGVEAPQALPKRRIAGTPRGIWGPIAVDVGPGRARLMPIGPQCAVYCVLYTV